MTGEYVVMHGATALAVSLRKGQAMEIEFTPGPETIITWSASDSEETWFEATLARNEKFEVLSSGNQAIADRLLFILNSALELNPEFLSNSGTYACDCRIMFERHWGWGTSSTLISNIAYWADVDPYELNRKVTVGSGYDIACARAESAVLYRLTSDGPEVEEVDFYPWFHHHFLFVYLGRKQDTLSEIARFEERQQDLADAIPEISDFSVLLYKTKDLDEFMAGIRRHEEILSGLLGRSPVKEELFPDFNGEVKSLGAWGGDFVLAVSTDSEQMMREYFTAKGYDVHFDWDQIVLYET